MGQTRDLDRLADHFLRLLKAPASRRTAYASVLVLLDAVDPWLARGLLTPLHADYDKRRRARRRGRRRRG